MTTRQTAPMTEPRCPRCQSTAITPKRIGVSGGYLYEFLCTRCGAWEDHDADEADFPAWWARWHAAPAAGAPSASATGEVTGATATATPGSRDALLAAVCAAPDDDAPRLRYADAIAGSARERAELIRLQIERTASERARRALVDESSLRERTLLARHGDDWARPLDPFVRPTQRPRPDPGWRFERGFLSFVRIDADTLASLGDRLFRMAPIRHLDFTPDQPLRAALASPLLGRLRTLGLAACNLDDDDAIALAANPDIGALRWLDLRDNQIGARGIAALGASAAVRAIPIVLLANNPADPAQQYSLDWDSSVADSWLPPAGAELEAAHGGIGWLHLPPSHQLPDRYHVE